MYSRRWSSNPSGKCSYERPTRGTVCGTMRSMCGADAGCLAINYQSLYSRISKRGVLRRQNARANKASTSRPVQGSRDRYFIAEKPAPAPHLAYPEGRSALRIVLVTVPRVNRSCEHFPDGLDLHLLLQGLTAYMGQQEVKDTHRPRVLPQTLIWKDRTTLEAVCLLTRE